MTDVTLDPIRRNPEVLERSLDGETVLYLPSTDAVVVLDVIGSAVWRHLDAPVTMPALSNALAAAFEQPIERIESDIAPLIEELLAGAWIVQAQ